MGYMSNNCTQNQGKLALALQHMYSGLDMCIITSINNNSSFAPLISIKLKAVKEPNSIFQAK